MIKIYLCTCVLVLRMVNGIVRTGIVGIAKTGELNEMLTILR